MIENIYSDYRINFVDKPDFVLDFYEKNAIYFNNIKAFKDKEELRQYIEIIGKYAESIYKKDWCNQASKVDVCKTEKEVLDLLVEEM